MGAAFKALHGKPRDVVVPGRFLVGSKLDELIENDPQVEKLTEVSHKEDGEEELIVPEVTAAGGIKVRKGAAIKSKAPRDGAELRTKYSLIVNAWLFARTRFTSREWLATLKTDSYVPLAEYILGDKVAGLKSAELGPSRLRISPEWAICLEYEYEIRKLAYEHIRDDGLDMLDAMAKAMRDEQCRSMFLTAPFGQQVAKYSADFYSTSGILYTTGGADVQPRSLPWMRGNEGGKGKVGKAKGEKGGAGKGKGTGSGKGKVATKVSKPGHPDDGKAICFKFNNSEACDASCGRAHVCQKCLGNHAKGSCRGKGGK
jgi:hypothetical protein